ncbi:PmbA/TldA family metallopeptidase [Paenibacillus eucommiae]|uniref:PmbA/TldA family metallopeptidase n=1 Tax=Paenibacillus eucommiae TaxID=1355755 RepID=UPI0035E45D5B
MIFVKRGKVKYVTGSDRSGFGIRKILHGKRYSFSFRHRLALDGHQKQLEFRPR